MGRPPPEVSAGLRDLFVQINLGPFLERRGLSVSELPGNLQIAQGGAGFGAVAKLGLVSNEIGSADDDDFPFD